MTLFLATDTAETLGFAASVEGHIWAASDSVNNLFAILLQKITGRRAANQKQVADRQVFNTRNWQKSTGSSAV